MVVMGRAESISPRGSHCWVETKVMGAKEKDGPRLLFGMGAAPRVCPSQQWSPFLGLVTGRCPHICFIYGSQIVWLDS